MPPRASLGVSGGPPDQPGRSIAVTMRRVSAPRRRLNRTAHGGLQDRAALPPGRPQDIGLMQKACGSWDRDEISTMDLLHREKFPEPMNH
jgi:hypothetical protein